MSFRFQIEALDGQGARRPLRHASRRGEDSGLYACRHRGDCEGRFAGHARRIGRPDPVEQHLSPLSASWRRDGAQVGWRSEVHGWDKPILTDSGGFQVFSLSDLRKLNEDGVEFRSHLDGSSHFFSPENAIAAEIGLGADIIMAFDECMEHPADYKRTQDSMEMTLRWAIGRRIIGRRTRRSSLVRPFVVIQSPVPRIAYLLMLPALRSDDRRWSPSSQYEEKTRERLWDGLTRRRRCSESCRVGCIGDLRRESAHRTVEIDFPGYAIGGLSVGEPREKTWEMVQETIPLLPADKPRYVMGVGTPEEIVQYVSLGVDMMDCVLPTRAARHGLLFTSEGKVNIKNSRYAQDEGPLIRPANVECVLDIREPT